METGERATSALRRDWTALPAVALAAVVLLLRSLPDFGAFGSVCGSWRLVAKAVSLPPLLYCNRKRGLLCLSTGRFCRSRALARRRDSRVVIGYSHGHLIFKYRNRPWLLNPITRVTYLDFPRCAPTSASAVLSSPPTSHDFALLLFDRNTVQYCRLGDAGWTLLHERRRPPEWVGDVEDIAFVGWKGYLLCTSAAGLRPSTSSPVPS